MLSAGSFLTSRYIWFWQKTEVVKTPHPTTVSHGNLSSFTMTAQALDDGFFWFSS